MGSIMLTTTSLSPCPLPPFGCTLPRTLPRTRTRPHLGLGVEGPADRVALSRQAIALPGHLQVAASRMILSRYFNYLLLTGATNTLLLIIF